MRLTDVCPFTLGVDSGQRDQHGNLHVGLFSPIIDRNTPIPVSRVAPFSTLGDNQRHVDLTVYQGEARLVEGNVKLGKVTVPVPPRPAGHVQINVRFSYDSSGLLEVDVEVPETGTKRNLVIVDEEDTIDAKELETRRKALAKLKFHPRDDDANMAVMARAQRCYESYIGERRDVVGVWILAFESALEKQEPRAIIEAREALIAGLDELDGERYL